MNFVTFYRCPRCTNAFKPEKQFPLFLRCPKCDVRWFLSIRPGRLALAYLGACAGFLLATQVFPERGLFLTIALPAVIWLLGFCTTFQLVSAEEVQTTQQRWRKSPFSPIAAALLGAMLLFASVGVGIPFWNLMYVEALILPPAITLGTFRFAVFFRTRTVSFLLMGFSLLVMVLPALIRVPTLPAILSRVVAFFVLIGSGTAAATVRENPSAPR